MSVDRMKRVNVLLHREIASGMYRILGESEIDIASITVTKVSVTRNLRQAKVMVSIRDHKEERDKILSRLRSHRKDFQEYISESVVLKYTPRIFFALDESIEKGDHVLDILSKIDVPEELPTNNEDSSGYTDHELPHAETE